MRIIVIHYKVQCKFFFLLYRSQTLMFKVDLSFKNIISDQVNRIPTHLIGHMGGNSLCKDIYKLQGTGN